MNKNRKKAEKKDVKSTAIIHVLSEEPITADEELAISKALRPTYISLMCFGLIWKSQKRSSSKKCADCHTCFCIFMTVLLWCYALHHIVLFDGKVKFDVKLIVKGTTIIHALQIALCFTAFVYFNHKHIPFFLRQWENYKLKHGGISLALMRKHVSRRMIGGNIVLALFFMCLVVVHTFGTSENNKYKRYVIPLLSYTHGSSRKVLQYIWGPLVFYIFASLFQTVLVATTICSLLSKEFNQLSKEFAETVSKNSNFVYSGMQRWNSHGHLQVPKTMTPITYEIEQFRLRHLDLVFLVARLDSVMHTYLLLLYLFSLPSIILLLFGMGDAAGMMFEDLGTYISGVSGLIYMSATIIWIMQCRDFVSKFG